MIRIGDHEVVYSTWYLHPVGETASIDFSFKTKAGEAKAAFTIRFEEIENPPERTLASGPDPRNEGKGELLFTGWNLPGANHVITAKPIYTADDLGLILQAVVRFTEELYVVHLQFVGVPHG